MMEKLACRCCGRSIDVPKIEKQKELQEAKVVCWMKSEDTTMTITIFSINQKYPINQKKQQ